MFALIFPVLAALTLVANKPHPPLVPCDTDTDCMEKNPWVKDPFRTGEK